MSTEKQENKIQIAILGGGPSGLFMFKRLVDSGRKEFSIDIIEKNTQLGAGMPYSIKGANDEHITNVSGNEIPELVTSISDWIKTVPQETLDRFHIDSEKFNDYKVLPRLLFGQYLSAQFDLLLQQAKEIGINTNVCLNSPVTDIIDYPERNRVAVEISGETILEYDHIIICTGHRWPLKHENAFQGYFDSPYPPAKLAFKINHPVAIKGSSLTAIDAIRTMARQNGTFHWKNEDKLVYKLNEDSPGFKMVMHSRSGLLPAIRFHLADSHLLKDSVLSPEVVEKNKAENDGFLSLDFVFEQNFKEMIRDKEPGFYEQIREMSIETFVDSMMDLRERIDPFLLFKAEYTEAEKSIKRKESVYWKEMLAVLSFAMNYPAKHFSAEDMQRLQKVLMPLISIVIAFVPQGSVEEMLALNDAGVLEIIPVGDDSYTEPHAEGGAIYFYTDEMNQQQNPHFKTYVDCVGQPHLNYQELPYKSLLSKRTVSPARIKFKDEKIGRQAMENGNEKVETDGNGNYYLNVPGITINDNFQIIDDYGALNERIYIMAVPYIGGYNPDYSGLDFCEAASENVIKSLLASNPQLDFIKQSEA
ncbi:FAD/NAD(P)-binding protein [Pedobacter fastidiosus]|uniref:FAD/NAD(P)-binding protein n=1 Tax=Pedobacter fastidiosus TaxID=2765361 RepID=A0ABR7KYZ7_9SPHI|nr:FAD/NAD(P)-binding protein [Pedobacter fastidiosus]MBC6113139.1 FAD/NAD(P)-binding protein [Pedobacter fastidiosus]